MVDELGFQGSRPSWPHSGGLPMPLMDIVTDLNAQAEVVRIRRYGVIEAVEGRFRRIVLRPFPKLVSLPEVLLAGWLRNCRPGDRCLMFYDQPWRFPNFLTVKYVISSRDATYATGCRIKEALEEVARIKGTDAILATVANWRISPRFLARWGWEPHCRRRWQRHYIRRFYGNYPPRPEWLRDVAETAQDGKDLQAEVLSPVHSG